MPSARMNQGKPLLSFILDFPKALTAFARVKEMGAVKYDFDNWKKGGKPDREYLDAALRHMLAFKNGEAFADDSGCHHLAHAMWNMAACLELNCDVVVDGVKFKAACDYWQARKDFPETMERIDNVILDRVEEFLDSQEKTEADAITEDERAAIARVRREGR